MKDLLVIIVIYNKPISKLYLIQNNNLSNSKTFDIFIYDNSPKKQVIPDISNVKFHYVFNKNNAGVSKGYNCGIKKAKELCKKYVVLLDQDSQILFSNFENYLSLYNKYGDKYIYAPIMKNYNKIYSPGYINYFAGKVQKKKDFIYKEMYSLKDKSLINSGLFFDVTLVESIGTFNEKIKLDFSDFDFIEKYKKTNNNIILLNLFIEHNLSGDEGKDYHKEMLRYKYYCNGAKFFSMSSKKLKLFPVFRRMLRLMVKYKSLHPIGVFIKYFAGNKVL
jgi:GT2 family glycosyltransferase